MTTTPTDTKKEWAAPELTVYGRVEEITSDPKWKDLGGSDDWKTIPVYSAP